MTSNDDYVLEILQENEILGSDQVQEAAELIKQHDESTLDLLIQRGVISEDEVLGAIAMQFGMDLVDLNEANITDELIAKIKPDTARRYKVVPVDFAGDTLTVALSDPLDFDTLDSLRYLLKCNVEGVIASRDQIKIAIDKAYPGETNMESVLGMLEDGDVDVASASDNEIDDESSGSDTDAPIIKLVSLIILEAFRHRASDIHLEPMEKSFKVRYRIDGVLHEVDSPPRRLQSAIISRVKIMAEMKISEKRVPQDGRIQVKVKGRSLDLRVSSVPTNHGESIVMRILDKSNLSLGLPQLGFLSDDQATFERLINLPDGVILVTGPTGSGKTTTLYACLSQINTPDRKLITVENPVEYQMTGVNQVQVNTDVGLTFSAALRSILRQAPNIIMIGEIRDIETANIATEAALTGHLVFSTLHTNDAPSAVTRLLDIGVKPFLVASSLRAAIAQRLVRCICPDCKDKYEPDEKDLRALGALGADLRSAQLYRGRGCQRCSMTGYTGRKGIFEIFHVDDEIQHMIFENKTSSDLRKRVRELGMRTLREDGLRKIVSGLTTIEEVLRVTMGDVD